MPAGATPWVSAKMPTVPKRFMVEALRVMLPPPSVLVDIAVAVVVILAVPSRFRSGVLMVMLPALPAAVVWALSSLLSRIESALSALIVMLPAMPLLLVLLRIWLLF